ncbi:hypothetical protein V1525DRAFT_395967, partial [Lipomyces kononenkoae]
ILFFWRFCACSSVILCTLAFFCKTSSVFRVLPSNEYGARLFCLFLLVAALELSIV